MRRLPALPAAGTYSPGSSVLHRSRAGWKLAGLGVLLVALVVTASVPLTRSVVRPSNGLG